MFNISVPNFDVFGFCLSCRFCKLFQLPRIKRNLLGGTPIDFSKPPPFQLLLVLPTEGDSFVAPDSQMIGLLRASS